MNKFASSVRPDTAPRYWYSDGLPDIGVGLGFWLMTAVLLNMGQIPTILGRVVALPFTGFFISLLFPWLIRTVRTRWLADPPILTAPRPTLRYQLLGMALLVPLVTLLGLLVAQLGTTGDLAGDAADLFALSVGLFVSLVPLLLGFISGAMRYYLVALPIILGTLWLVLRPAFAPDPGLSLVLAWLVTGLCFMLSGLFALAYFRWRR